MELVSEIVEDDPRIEVESYAALRLGVVHDSVVFAVARYVLRAVERTALVIVKQVPVPADTVSDRFEAQEVAVGSVGS